MAADRRWYFTKEDIENSPSRKYGIDAEKELNYRQKEAKFIQEMGQRLQFAQLTINTAIVYMHRFYMFHTFTRFHRNTISPAALFLAAKVEEEPRKLEHVIKAASPDQTLDTQSEAYLEKSQELVMNENILLQTLGFDVAIDHPHTHVVKFFQMVRADTNIPRTSYFMATNSLHMTTMCLQYKPAVVACVCINMVCKWSRNEIQWFPEGQDWFCHVDSSVTHELLERLTTEFLSVMEKFPPRIKKLIPDFHGGPSSSLEGNSRHSGTLTMGMIPPSLGGPVSMRNHDDILKPGGKSIQPMTSKTIISRKDYTEKKEKERREKEKERERAEHRDRHMHHIAAGAHPPPYSVSSTHPPHPSNNRLQLPDGHPRKPHSDPTRQMTTVHSSTSRAVLGVPYRDPSHRRENPTIRGGEITDRTIRPMHPKIPPEKIKASGEHRHPHKYLVNTRNHNEAVSKDKKLEPKVELKSEPKEMRLPVEVKDIKSETRTLGKPFIPKAIDPSIKIKSEPMETKTEPKEELKANSFIFNNNSFSNSFSMNDFLNPSDLPPDDIFDTEMESKHIIDPDMLEPVATLHHKLKSPPKPTSNPLIGFSTASPIPNTVNNRVSVPPPTTIVEKIIEQQPHPHNESKSNNLHPISQTQIPIIDKISKATENLSDLGAPAVQIKQSQKRNKEKVTASAPPVIPMVKLKHDDDTTISNLPVTAPVEQKHRGIKENSSHNRSHVEISSATAAMMKVASISLERLPNSDKTVFAPLSAKTTSVADMKADVIKVRVPHPDVDANFIPPVDTTITIPTLPPNMEGLKKSKREHHKKKEKRKSKHKEHKHKAHKEHKKLKKKAKHKGKDKEKTPKLKEESSMPLKLTIVRGEKGVYTPEGPPITTRVTPTPVINTTPSSSSTPLDTPGRIKLTIPRSRLQTNTPVSEPILQSYSSSDISTPKVKLKIPRDQLRPDKESRKRDRDSFGSSDNGHPAKMSRASTSHGMQPGGQGSY